MEIKKNDKKTGNKEQPCDQESRDELLATGYDVVSGTECTGLIPTIPLDIYQQESYEEIYGVPTPADVRQKVIPEGKGK